MEVTNNTNNVPCTTAAEINGDALYSFPSSSLLPPEILVNIFSFLSDSVKDLLLCAQVNRTWHHIITSFYIWRTVKFKKFETFLGFHETLQLITKTRKNRALDNWSRFLRAYLSVIKSPISEEEYEEEEEEEKDVETQISVAKQTYFHSTQIYGYFVKKLDLSGINRKNLITEEMLRDLFPNIPNLESVNFYNCYMVTDRVIEKLTSSCRYLKKLKFFGCTSLTNRSLYWIETRCPKLTTLNIGFCIIITPSALQNLVDKCEELRSLTISHCLNTRAISLIPMIPSLRKLDLGNSNPKLTDETTNIISQHCPNLVYLSLSFSLITSKGLKNIGQGYIGKNSKILEVSSSNELPPFSNEERSRSKIKKLILDNCEISDKNLKQIFYCCKNLEYLDISLVYDVDDGVLRVLCDQLENLKEVIASNCYGVSVAMQNDLSKHQRIKFTF
ncbi:F-box/LRR-repeat protein 20 isoform X3 [Rhizophagus clarus]|uniref:F-box/LRR-repeat protein 20 isoform X3 n=1 Tax=Rhizophagus clarus TaxID=94130 RepID=A0A8H3LQB9_9GLOM|nr:F-box/LRR-repeat protein 20 isoform X3 [Rhizophagus clarus]